MDKSFAIQAGREIRVMVVPEHVSDSDMVLLARDISKQIEAELEYPGTDQSKCDPRVQSCGLRKIKSTLNLIEKGSYEGKSLFLFPRLFFLFHS